MGNALSSKRRFCVLSGLSGIAGVTMLGLSFAFAVGPPANATRAELIEFAQQHYAAVLWGAWLQTIGPVFIILFALALVHLSSATLRLSGWMTLFGGSVLMTVSLIEITYYISALFPEPEMMSSISLRVIFAVQHLYFNVAAPALFLPLGIVLINSEILPRVFGYLAIVLAATFACLGIAFQLRLILPTPVTAFAGVQALWWLTAGIMLVARSEKISQLP
jgi:hypothetical protein